MDDFDKELQAIFDRYNAKMDAAYKRIIFGYIVAFIANVILLVTIIISVMSS